MAGTGAIVAGGPRSTMSTPATCMTTPSSSPRAAGPSPDLWLRDGIRSAGREGCLKFSTATDPMLRWMPFDGEACTPEYRATTGYQQELEYFASCIESGTPPTRVTGFDAREAVRLVMAEKQSGRPARSSSCRYETGDGSRPSRHTLHQAPRLPRRYAYHSERERPRGTPSRRHWSVGPRHR